jgi:hypothetical protein
MALNAGNPEATQGLARDIFVVLDAHLRPPLEEGLDDPAAQLPPIQDAWRQLAFCIASGVIEHVVRVPASKSEFAETFSSAAQDAAYWNWLAALAGVLRTWASGAGDAAALRTALNGFFGANPTAPAQLRGIVR